ncbi:hypothetical protein wVul_1192 [Wolbachia endosymbiont of Armadillidium vulgare str. wVulC]|nr:hypothetical protein wVul_1192 [Wolbachia endosymbiont of Armadillidium vulgare str. wVulC]
MGKVLNCNSLATYSTHAAFDEAGVGNVNMGIWIEDHHESDG